MVPEERHRGTVSDKLKSFVLTCLRCYVCIEMNCFHDSCLRPTHLSVCAFASVLPCNTMAAIDIQSYALPGLHYCPVSPHGEHYYEASARNSVRLHAWYLLDFSIHQLCSIANVGSTPSWQY